MRRKRVLLGAVGGLLTLLAGLAVIRPGLVLGVEPLAGPIRTVSSMRTRTLLIGGSAMVGLYVAWAARSATEDRFLDEETDAAERFERIEERPPERVTADERTLSARDLDQTVAFAVAGDGAALDQARRRLRSLAVARLARTDFSGDSADGSDASAVDRSEMAVGSDSSASDRGDMAVGSTEGAVGPADGPGPSAGSESDGATTAVIAGGTWTEDRTAAAFLAAEGGPDHSLFSRLRLWLDPDAERERRIQRTVAAIDALGGEDR